MTQVIGSTKKNESPAKLLVDDKIRKLEPKSTTKTLPWYTCINENKELVAIFPENKEGPWEALKVLFGKSSPRLRCQVTTPETPNIPRSQFIFGDDRDFPSGGKASMGDEVPELRMNLKVDPTVNRDKVSKKLEERSYAGLPKRG
jgi:hypothetical protein